MEEELKTLSDRLAYALDKLNISQAELARKINVKRQAIQYLCTSGMEKSKFAFDIAEALNINVDWLASGKGEMVITESSEQRLLLQQQIVPLLEWSEIDMWLGQHPNKEFITKHTVAHDMFSKRTFALKLKDNSMFPRFDSSTIIIVDPEQAPTPPCFVLVQVKKIHDAVFRRLDKQNGQLVLYAFNEAGYKELPLSDEDQILGRMVEAKWLAQ